MRNTFDNEPLEQFEGHKRNPDATKEQIQADKKEQQFETKNGIAQERKEFQKPEVDEQLIEDLKTSIHNRMKSEDVPDARSAAAETNRKMILEVPKKEVQKADVRPSWVNALFLKPSKKIVKETWGLLKRGKKLFGMTAILGLSHLGASASPTVQGAPSDSLKKGDSMEKTVSYEAPLSAQVKQEWNEFIDWMNAEAKEDPSLIKRLNHDQSLGKEMLEQFIAAHPGTELRFDMVARIQDEVLELRESVQDFEKRHGRDGSQLYKNPSKKDGWIGENTLRTAKFPKATIMYPGGAKKDLGLINGDLTADVSYKLRAQIPPGVDLVKESNGDITYIDPQSGDIKRIPPGALK